MAGEGAIRMTSPFDIEEMFPDAAPGAVRIPRRQSGNAPQGMVVTLLADYTLRTGAGLPSAALVALLAESGVSVASARAAISRLARRGVLERLRDGRHSSYRLHPSVATQLSLGGRWIISVAASAPSWDEHWTLVAFSLPQDEGSRRRALRGQLRWLGYAPLYDGLWISPGDLTAKARSELTGPQAGFTGVTIFRARHIELAASSGRDPINAWNIGEIASAYEDFLRRWNPTLKRVRSGRLTGAEAVRARTEVMDTYRRFPTLDPQLPLELLPTGWPRGHAYDLFAAVYDGLVEAAQEHVRAVTAGVVGEPQPGVHAHTTADLLAGVASLPRQAGPPTPRGLRRRRSRAAAA
jgi:phenylacetic acid degradation operon negative regulatory protein